MVKQVINDIVKTKYLSKSLVIHATFILSISLSSISKHLDLKNEKARKELLNNYKIINTSVVFENNNQQQSSDTNIQQSQPEVVKPSIAKPVRQPSPKLEQKTQIKQNTIKQTTKIEAKKPEINPIQEMQKTTEPAIIVPQQIQTKEEEQQPVQEDEIIQPSQEEQEIAQMSQKLSQYDSTKINTKTNNKTQATSGQQVNKLTFIEQQIQTCWSRYSAGKTPNRIMIRVKVKYDQNGNVQKITPLQDATDIAAQNMQESAIRAIKDCNPINTEQIYDIYDQWKEIVFNFQYQ
jgi:outer membrane biosynthesis protein TonB